MPYNTGRSITHQQSQLSASQNALFQRQVQVVPCARATRPLPRPEALYEARVSVVTVAFYNDESAPLPHSSGS